MAKGWKIQYFDPDDSLNTAMGKILWCRLRETFSHQGKLFRGNNSNAIHDMRISARRLQTMMKIFRECIPKTEFNRYYGRIKNLISLLGSVRDHDVFIAILEDYRQGLPNGELKVIELLIRKQKIERSHAQSHLFEALRRIQKEEWEISFRKFINSLPRITLIRRENPIQPEKSYRENVRVIIPKLFRVFISHKKKITYHPRSVIALHKMRIDGKPLRYLMETLRSMKEKSFQWCLEEIKYLLELLGKIHDCDNNIQKLRAFLTEIRSSRLGNGKNWHGLLARDFETLIAMKKSEREELYNEVLHIFKKWDMRKFQTKLLYAMNKI